MKLKNIEMLIDKRDIRNSGHFIDGEKSVINQTYDMIVIGGGGLLLPFFVNAIFRDVESWQKLQVPLVF